jgi:hypothetical protein
VTILFTNNAKTTLSAGITNVATSIPVAAGYGALFPAPSGSDFFYATLTDVSNNIEIVKVTSRSTDTMTVVRGQEGTTARAYLTGDKFQLRITAASLTAFVQLAGTQTLTNKTIDTAGRQHREGQREHPGGVGRHGDRDHPQRDRHARRPGDHGHPDQQDHRHGRPERPEGQREHPGGLGRDGHRDPAQLDRHPGRPGDHGHPDQQDHRHRLGRTS